MSFLIMEYVSNDLEKLFKAIQSGQLVLNEEQITILMYNMLCAVSFIHRSNIVHRDIKP